MPGLHDHRLIFDSDGGGLQRRIYSMRADGTDLEALTGVDELARAPALSPDGAQLAYATPEGIKLLDMATRESKLLVSGADQLMWSADGTLLAYRGVGTAYTEIGAVQSDGTTEYVWGCSYCWSPELRPDSDVLVYVNETRLDTVGSLWSVFTASWTDPAVGTAVISESPIRVQHPTVSGDGVWVAAAFQCSGGEQSSLWVSPFSVPTPACEGHRITPAGSPSVTNPKWGPGTFIAYERGEPPRDIAVVQADTGEECVIAGPGDDRNPSWGLPIVPIPE